MMNFWNSKFNTDWVRLCSSEHTHTKLTADVDHEHAI